MAKRILIVGGVAGGATAAARLRRLSEEDEVLVFERGEYVSFGNCGLPYFIGDVIKEKDRLLLASPELFRNRYNVDARIFSEVIKIDRANCLVVVRDLKNGNEYIEKYDHLILSPGANPIKPPMPGIDDPRIFTLRTVPDAVKIKTFIHDKKPKRAVVVGGGFIGLEMAENLHERGIHVEIVEKLPQVMPNLDPEIANIITDHMKSKNVGFVLGVGIKGFKGNDKTIISELDDGTSIESEMVILSIGVRPDTKLAIDAGLEVMPNGAIKVDSEMRTNDKHIFAVGDAVVVDNPIIGGKWGIQLAGPANRQARIIADVINGIKEKYHGTYATSVVKIFDLTVASTGCSEKYLKANNIAYEKSYTHTGNHAGYYPGATPISIKLLFDPKSGKLYGAEMTGFNGVDKRIDVIASVMKFGGVVADLKHVELAYAPPYGSAKDPVNMAGYVADNIITKMVEVVHFENVAEFQAHPEKYQLVDVRTSMEYDLGTIKGAMNIPIDEIRARLNDFSRDKTVIVFCQVGMRGYLAYRILKQNGFNVRNLSGGYKTFVQSTKIHSKFKAEMKEHIGSDDMPLVIGSSPKTANAVFLDACGLSCPGPIRKTFEKMQELRDGDVLEVAASDPGFARDIETWCETTGNELVSLEMHKGNVTVKIKKRSQEANMTAATSGDEKTIVVFSGDLDKVLASFVIATGAASMGKKVNMFFTFWGLNAMKKGNVAANKDLLSKMFGWMMPGHAGELKLSKLHMFGFGTRLMKYVMKKKNVDTLPVLIAEAKKLGVKMTACQMSMDVMGIHKSELIDEIETAGVASFIGDTDRSNATMFI